MTKRYVAHHSNMDDGTGEMGLTEAGRFYYDSNKKKFFIFKYWDWFE
jgi:hypothetical protein